MSHAAATRDQRVSSRSAHTGDLSHFLPLGKVRKGTVEVCAVAESCFEIYDSFSQSNES